MATLEELKRQNERLKNQLKSKTEIEQIQKKRADLLEENSKLLRRIKSKGTFKTSPTGKKIFSIGKGFQRRLQVAAQNEVKAQRLEKKANKRR